MAKLSADNGTSNPQLMVLYPDDYFKIMDCFSLKVPDPAQADGSLPSETRLSGRSHQYFGTCGGCGHTYGGIAAQMMQSLRSHRPMQFP